MANTFSDYDPQQWLRHVDAAAQKAVRAQQIARSNLRSPGGDSVVLDRGQHRHHLRLLTDFETDCQSHLPELLAEQYAAKVSREVAPTDTVVDDGGQSLQADDRRHGRIRNHPVR